MIHLNSHFFNKHYAGLLSAFSFLFVCASITSAYLVYFAPHDYLQGVYAKIMYIHVPAAWFSMGLYSVISLLSLGYLTFKNPFYFSIAKVIAPLGCCFVFITLTTGAIWGKPTWGTWWVWDARLTSMLILFFIYIGYIGLINSFDIEERSAFVSSIFAIVGFINIPIIKFSVDIWNTLHQPSSVLRLDGPTIHSSMLITLITFAFAFLFFSCIVVILRLKTDMYKKKINRLECLVQYENGN